MPNLNQLLSPAFKDVAQAGQISWRLETLSTQLNPNLPFILSSSNLIPFLSILLPNNYQVGEAVRIYTEIGKLEEAKRVREEYDFVCRKIEEMRDQIDRHNPKLYDLLKSGMPA